MRSRRTGSDLAIEIQGETSAPRRESSPSRSPVDARPKPRYRGVSHLYAAFFAAIAGVVLVLVAAGLRAQFAVTVYGVAQTALFSLSALYHLPLWGPRQEPWLRRLDHAGIFVFIAASYTPFCMLALDRHGATLLTLVWVVSGLGLLRTLMWNDAPPWICAATYVAQGCMLVPFLPDLAVHLGFTGIALVSLAGVCFIVGAIIFSLRRPDPVPAVFGYHEIFHVLVILGCTFQFGAISRLVASSVE